MFECRENPCMNGIRAHSQASEISLYHVVPQLECGCEPGSRPSQKNRLAGALILGFPAPETLIECISVVYEFPSISYFVTVSQTRIKLSLKCLLNVMKFVDLKIWRIRLNLKV